MTRLDRPRITKARSHDGCARLAVATLVGAGLAFPTMALAQMPPEIAAKVAALGRVVDPENTAKFYTPLQEKEPYAGIKVVRDVKYGAHDRNVVDIFTPDAEAAPPQNVEVVEQQLRQARGAFAAGQATRLEVAQAESRLAQARVSANGATGRPVLMFVHGGGYTRGNKRPPGSAFYDNIMVFAARHGMVGVNVEYRLAPEFPWPAGPEDMGAAVRFVGDKIASYGGDPNRVFLMGHSAGAGHVAAYVSHPEFFGPKGSGLAGAIFSSGPSYVLNAQEPLDGHLFRRRRITLCGARRPAGPPQDHHPVHDIERRTRPTGDRRTVRRAQGRHVQIGARLRAQHRAAQAQPHVGVLRDQHGGYPAFRPDSRIRQDRQIAPSAANGTFTIALTR
jgi:acetyl esterase/lipase